MADDKRNNLYEYFIKWVDIFRPKFFVMENVKGIQNSFAGGQKYSDLIKSEFEKIGYSTELFELNSENFGVPQKRIRIFFIGSRTTENFEISNYSLFNRPQNIWDAISDLSFLEPKEGNESQSYVLPVSSDYQGWARKNSDVLFNHQSMNHTERMIERYKALQNGTWFEDLPSHLRVKKRNGGGILSSSRFRLNYRILEKDKQSFTIPASFYSSFIHPTQPRNITAREAARIQSYPDNYVFRGKRTEISSSLLKRLGKEFSLSQYNQIGNSVPPLLAYGIALNLKKYLLK
jgi:DNA (cytosine-5)-methyltransferase 1